MGRTTKVKAYSLSQSLTKEKRAIKNGTQKLLTPFFSKKATSVEVSAALADDLSSSSSSDSESDSDEQANQMIPALLPFPRRQMMSFDSFPRSLKEQIPNVSYHFSSIIFFLAVIFIFYILCSSFGLRSSVMVHASFVAWH